MRHLSRELAVFSLIVGLAGCGHDYSRWFVSVSPTVSSSRLTGEERAALDACAEGIELRANPTYPSTLELVAVRRKDAEAFATCAHRLRGLRVSEVMALNVDPRNKPAHGGG